MIGRQIICGVCTRTIAGPRDGAGRAAVGACPSCDAELRAEAGIADHSAELAAGAPAAVPAAILAAETTRGLDALEAAPREAAPPRKPSAVRLGSRPSPSIYQRRTA
jgi:hypothetical protein